MRPSPGVTVRQYFFMSVAQAFSTFSIRAVSFSKTNFPIFVCACAEPTDRTASIGNSPSLAEKRMVVFIEGPLMTGSEPDGCVERRRAFAMEVEGCFRSNFIVPRKELDSKRQETD